MRIAKTTAKRKTKRKRRPSERKSSTARKLLQTFLQNETLEKAAAYAARGRSFQHLSWSALHKKSAIALKAWATDPALTDRGDFDDCESEYLLRGVPLPPAGKDFEASLTLMALRAEAMAERIANDPRLTRQLRETLLAEIARIARQTKRGKN
jgi:hypothetical protein